MIWILMIFLVLLIGICIGATAMYYKNRNLLNNHKALYNELQNNKNKLNEYQKKLNTHFSYNIDLLNKISENYQNLYQNMIKSANFFLPNTYIQDNIYPYHTKNIYKEENKEGLSMEIPLDYSKKIEKNEQKNLKI